MAALLLSATASHLRRVTPFLNFKKNIVTKKPRVILVGRQMIISFIKSWCYTLCPRRRLKRCYAQNTCMKPLIK